MNSGNLLELLTSSEQENRNIARSVGTECSVVEKPVGHNIIPSKNRRIFREGCGSCKEESPDESEEKWDSSHSWRRWGVTEQACDEAKSWICSTVRASPRAGLLLRQRHGTSCIAMAVRNGGEERKARWTFYLLKREKYTWSFENKQTKITLEQASEQAAKNCTTQEGEKENQLRRGIYSRIPQLSKTGNCDVRKRRVDGWMRGTRDKGEVGREVSMNNERERIGRSENVKENR